MKTLHVIVLGNVQGVGYRYGLSEAAVRLGVDGWVRNRRDGSVEAVFRGTPAGVDALLAWARRGPPAARVRGIDTRTPTDEELAAVSPGFNPRPTV